MGQSVALAATGLTLGILGTHTAAADWTQGASQIDGDGALDATKHQGKILVLQSDNSVRVVEGDKAWQVSPGFPDFEAKTIRSVNGNVLLGGHIVETVEVTVEGGNYADFLRQANVPEEAIPLQPLDGLDVAVETRAEVLTQYFPALVWTKDLTSWEMVRLENVSESRGGSVRWITARGQAVLEVYDEPASQETESIWLGRITIRHGEPGLSNAREIELRTHHGQIGFSSEYPGGQLLAFHTNHGTSFILLSSGQTREVLFADGTEVRGLANESGTFFAITTDTNGAEWAVDLSTLKVSPVGQVNAEKLSRIVETDLDVKPEPMKEYDQ